MPTFHKKGEAWKIHQRTSDPEGDYAKSLPGLLQKKLEALPPPRPVTHLKDMSPEKQEEMKRLYPAPARMGKRPVRVKQPSPMAHYKEDGVRFHDMPSLTPSPVKALLEEP